MVRRCASLAERALHVRGRSGVAGRQGGCHRREERGRLRGAALHRQGDAPAADGHVPGAAAAHGDDGRPASRTAAPGHPPTQARQLTEEERKRLAADAQRQMEEMQKQPPAMVEYTLYFDDWREVDGIKFPHSLRRAAAGATTEEWTVNKVRRSTRRSIRRSSRRKATEPGSPRRAKRRSAVTPQWCVSVTMWCLVVLLAWPAASDAQHGRRPARLRVIVRDPSGAVDPGGARPRPRRRGATRRSTREACCPTAREWPSRQTLVPGKYAIEVSFPGFETKTSSPTCGCAPARTGVRSRWRFRRSISRCRWAAIRRRPRPIPTTIGSAPSSRRSRSTRCPTIPTRWKRC